MRFRPSYYSQVQLTTYAPNGGYPGFYGGEEDEIQFQSSVGEMKQEEAKEPGVFEKVGGWLWRTFGGEVKEKAKEVAGDTVTKLTSGGTPSTTPSTTPTSTIKIPSNLTAAERALIDACKSKSFYQRPACLMMAVNKIEADRKVAKKAAASNTLWWVLGGTVVVGGVVAAVALSKKKGKRS
jgi:hypothetical protein